MSTENLILMQFLIGYSVFWVILFFLYGLVQLIDTLQRKIKQKKRYGRCNDANRDRRLEIVPSA